MRKPNPSPSIRTGLQRIDALAVSAAERASARAEFERAEAFADRLATLVRRVKTAVAKTAVAGSAGAFDTRRQRME